MRAAGRHDYHALSTKVPAPAGRKRLDRDLVADALDQHDRPRGRRLRERPGRGLGRSRRAMHITVQQPAGKLTAPGDVHRSRFCPCRQPYRAAASATASQATDPR